MDTRAFVDDGGQQRTGADGFQLVDIRIFQAGLQAAGQAFGPGALAGGDPAGQRRQVLFDLRGGEADRAREVLVEDQEFQDVPGLDLGGVALRQPKPHSNQLIQTHTLADYSPT